MKIKYIDQRPFIIQLKKYPGISIPNPKMENTFEVTEGEARRLLKWRNGILPCWELVEKPAPVRREREVKENGDR